MQSSHWWQRWGTPISPKNPFRSELEALGSFFVRSEVGDSTLPASDTPRAKPANPFRSGSDCTPSRTPERPAAAQKQGKTASPFIWRAEAENFTPRAFSTPREKSGNPFRIENDLWPLAKSSACVEQTADRKFKKPVKLPEDFDGKQPLKEYLMHFERCSIVNGWNEEEKAMFLTASLRGDSRKLLSGLTDAECRQYGKIVERLQLRFGVEKQAELHQARLLNRRQFEGESLQMLATDIRSMVDLAYQDVGAVIQERFAVQHFIDALNDKDDRLYLRREKPSTLDQALSLARELESFRLLDSNNSFRRAGSKVRAMETERTQLQMQVDRLRLQIEQQQQQLEAQENIIKQLNEFVVKQEKPQGTQTGKNRVPQGFARRGWECWICGDRGHLRRECPKWRENQSDQSSGNLNRASSRAQ